MIRIVLADDHAIVRAGFRALIDEETDLRIVAECGDTDDARRLVHASRPDVLVLDLSLPGGGLTLLPELRAALPELAILVLSMHDGEPYVSGALERGASGYVTKASATDELVPALRAVAAGGGWLSHDLQRPALPWPGLEGLGARKRDVFERLALGDTPKRIALDLGISQTTVYLHRASLYATLGVRNDWELRQRAMELGLPARKQPQPYAGNK